MMTKDQEILMRHQKRLELRGALENLINTFNEGENMHPEDAWAIISELESVKLKLAIFMGCHAYEKTINEKKGQ
jgi:hypothetical protein